MINYPNNKKIKVHQNNNSTNAVKKVANTHKRGQQLEILINQTNEHYIEHNRAFIYKKPTPIKIVNVVYPKQNFKKLHKITEAYFEKPSTTDYNGLYRGYYIDFEAKQTKYKSFNISANLHQHQINHLIDVNNHGGIPLLFISFYEYDQIFIIDFKELLSFIENKKSLVPLKFFQEHGFVVEQKYNPPLDYLPLVDQIIQRRKNNE
ncbi:MAG: Holliday junction resolvase RecU [Mycoplasmatales bacterium]